MFGYLGKDFIDERKPSSSTIRMHLYRFACAYRCAMVLMAFLTRTFPPRESGIQDVPGHGAPMQIEAYGGILFPMPQYMLNFVRSFNVSELVEEAQFNCMLFFWPYDIRKS